MDHEGPLFSDWIDTLENDVRSRIQAALRRLIIPP
jgi:hypothetical protein